MDGPDKLFFELASETRLGILGELLSGSLRMQEIARRMDLTGTEAFRQLGRMSEALLVQKQGDGTYSITPYGRLVLELSEPLELAFRHREFFMDHDIGRLPLEFKSRLGELAGAKLEMNTMIMIGRVEGMLMEAESHAWAVAEGDAPAVMSTALETRLQKGISFRFLVNRDRLPSKTPPLPRNLELRSMSEVPVALVVTEKEAAVCFRFLDGRMDYAGFHGADPRFLAWVRDLFLHLWSSH